MWVMMMATRLAGKARARAARARVTTMRVAGNEEDEGGKEMMTGTRVTGKRW